MNNKNTNSAINIHKAKKHLFTIIFLLFFSSSSAQSPKNDTTITSSNNILESIITYAAEDSIITNVKNKKVYLFNKANIKYEQIELSAGFIEIDWATNTLYATGIKDSLNEISQKPIFIENGQEYKADTISYNLKSKKGLIKKVITDEGEGFLHGEKVKKVDEKDFYISKGGFTTCSHEDPHFTINAKKLKIINGERIVSGPAYLEIANIPTPIVVPFGIFPNQNKQTSGIVFPSYGESANRGFFLTNGGYHFAFSDKINLTLKGDIYSHGGWGGKVLSSYKKRYKYNGNLTISFSKIKISEEHLPDYSITNDFFITWNHYQDAKARPNSIFSADINAGSSTFLQNNSINSNDVLTNTLTSNVSYSKSWTGKPFNFSANFRHSQNTQTNEIDLSLPEISFTVSRFYPFEKKEAVGSKKWYENIGISYTLNGKNQLTTYDSLLFNKQTLNEFNSGIKHYIPISTNIKLLKYVSLNPSINYTEYWYFNSSNINWNYYSNSEEIDTLWHFNTARDFNMNAQFTTKIYGTFQFNKKRLQAIRHVFTPSVNFTYRPDFSTDFWGIYDYYEKPIESDLRPTPTNQQQYSTLQNGIYGGPPSGKSGTISFNLINSLEAKIKDKNDTTNAIKKIGLLDDLSFSSAYNIAAEEFNWSNLTFSGRTNFFNDKLALTFNGSLDPYALDESGNRINVYNWNYNNNFLRLTSSSVALSIDFKNTIGKKQSDNVSKDEINDINENIDDYIDFSIPWNLSIDYTLNQSKLGFENTVSQSVRFNGDFNLTEKWKIEFSSGYDFTNKEFTYTTFNIYRDLHCWEMSFNWVPFGYQKSYFFNIKVKAPVLQDLKLTRKRSWYDY